MRPADWSFFEKRCNRAFQAGALRENARRWPPGKSFDSSARRKSSLVAALVILMIPPVQVALATVSWNPPFDPDANSTKSRGVAHREDHSRRSRCQWVPLKDIPERLHPFRVGFRGPAILRAPWLRYPRIREAIEEAQDRNDEPRGVSTITMQCARSLFLWQGRSYLRKALEAYYTLWMELLISKRGFSNSISITSSSALAFTASALRRANISSTTPDQLSRSQMVALAAILPNPLKWSPIRPK